MTNLLFRGPSQDDWDPQGYSEEDKVAEDLASLGMHDLSEDDEAKKKKDDLELLEEETLTPHVVAPVDEEEEELDAMAELARMEKKVRDAEMTLGDSDEE